MYVLIKGAGDLATGVACRLHACGYNVVMTELAMPLTVRRAVAFSSAIAEGSIVVEGIPARRCENAAQAVTLCRDGIIPVLPDPGCTVRAALRPDVLVDATMVKRNPETRITDAPLVIALGPGFTAGVDCHCVIETLRGHDLGRCLYAGSAAADTGIPGLISGYGAERLLRAPCDGVFEPCVAIGDHVEAGAICAYVAGQAVTARIGGVVRGLLAPGITVRTGLKAGDIDPRDRREYCFTVSDKARSIGGGVLEAVVRWERKGQT